MGFAVGAAVCTGIGAVALRVAERDGKLDPLLKTTIRVLTSAVVFWVMPLARGRAGTVLGLLKDRDLTLRILAGSTLGVLTGMFCFVAALGYSEAALVTTIVATSPLLVLPLVAWRYRSRIRPTVILAMMVALSGVALIAFSQKRAEAKSPSTTAPATAASQPATQFQPRSLAGRFASSSRWRECALQAGRLKRSRIPVGRLSG